jgi:LysR family hydrogen peroxide-inducible transcriptional activator
VRLTLFGEQILKKAQSAIANANEIKQLAKQHNDLLVGLVRLGSVPTLAPFLFPHLLSEFRARFLGLRICPFEDYTEHLLEQLRQFRLDALLVPVPLPLQNHDFEVMELFQEPFVVALSPHSMLMDKREIAVEDLNSDELLVLEKRNCLHDRVLAICGDSSIKYPEERIASSIPNLLSMVSVGKGIAVIPQLVGQHEICSRYAGTVIFRPFASPRPARAIGLVWPRGSQIKKMLRSFGELIRMSAPKWAEPDRAGAFPSRDAALDPELQIHHQ